MTVTSLEEAVETARYNIREVQPAVVKPEFWQPCVIVRRQDGGHSVYHADAWTPHTGSLLPWSKPEGEPVGRVALDGSFERI